MTSNRLVTSLFLVLLAATFLLIGTNAVKTAVDASFDDTGSYLEGALFIREHGGVANFIKLALTGEYKISSQHPLYLLLLSPLASRELAFFSAAKLESLLFGLVVVLILFFAARDLFGDATAKIAAVLLILNVEFLERSSHVDCETLLTVFFLLAWYLMIKGLRDHRYWPWAGLAAGLAYMTKGPEILLIGVFLVASLLVFRLPIVRNRYFWSYFVAFLVAAAPLMIRNIIVYHNPLYEGYTSHVFWINSLRELSDRYALALNWHQHTFTTLPLPTPITYLQSHSLYDTVHRGLNGVRGELIGLVGSLDGVIGRAAPWRHVLSLFLSAAFVFGLVRDSDRRRVVYSLTVIVLFFLPFAWFQPVYGGMRFLTPMLPLILAYAAFGVGEFVKELDVRVLARRFRFTLYPLMAPILTLLLIPAAAYAAVKQNPLPLSQSVNLPDDVRELMDWFRTNVQEDDVVIFRPTVRYWGLLWHADFKGTVAMISRHDPLPEMSLTEYRQLLRDRNVSLVVVHADDYASPPILQEYFGYNATDGVTEKQPMEGWHRVYASTQNPPAFLIYRTDR